MPLDDAAKRKVYTETKQQLEITLKKNNERAKKLSKVESGELPRKSMQRVYFAFVPSPSTNPKDGLLKAHTKQKEAALEKAVTALAPKPKELCTGMAAVVVLNKKPVVIITSYKKKATGAPKKIHDYLAAWQMHYIVTEKLPAEGEADEVEEENEDETGTDAASSGQSDDGSQADESGEGEASETEEAPTPSATTAAAQAAAKLQAMPQIWTQTRTIVSKNIDQLTAAIRKEYASEPAEVRADIETGMTKLTQVAARFDHKLAEAMTKAHQAKDDAARKAELAKAKGIVMEHLKYVTSEPMIAHIDSNPFGVKTNLKQTLAATLTAMAKAVS